MSTEGRQQQSPSVTGFSLIELLVVVGLISIMLAVSVPFIAAYLQNYQLNGAMHEVRTEITRARTRAIVKNANVGVSFVVVDRNSYRWLFEDTDPPTYGPLRHLPSRIEFDPAGANAEGFRFQSLGTWCNPLLGGTCPTALPAALCEPAEVAAYCSDNPADYVTNDDAVGGSVTLRNLRNGIARQVLVTPGGRVADQ